MSHSRESRPHRSRKQQTKITISSLAKTLNRFQIIIIGDGDSLSQLILSCNQQLTRSHFHQLLLNSSLSLLTSSSLPRNFFLMQCSIFRRWQSYQPHSSDKIQCINFRFIRVLYYFYACSRFDFKEITMASFCRLLTDLVSEVT